MFPSDMNKLFPGCQHLGKQQSQPEHQTTKRLPAILGSLPNAGDPGATAANIVTFPSYTTAAVQYFPTLPTNASIVEDTLYTQ